MSKFANTGRTILIAQNATALETTSHTIQRAADAFEALERVMAKLEERAADGHNLKQLRALLEEAQTEEGSSATPLPQKEASMTIASQLRG